MTITMSDETLREYCEDCEQKTPHTVQIELRSESDDAENAGCSREPYRLSRCERCQGSSELRMNDA
jgi:hypothetical protein